MMIITCEMWSEFETVRQSGVMNMFGHRYARIFCNDDRYLKAFKHFETDGRTDDLVIE